jgi:hypothetical protein
LIIRAELGAALLPTPGQLLAERYRIERVLGAGSNGRVYQARDEATGEAVALKEFRRQKGRNDTFLREASALLELDHPHILACRSLVALESFRYLVCELMDGGSLRRLLDDPFYDPVVLLGLLREAAVGVAHAHGRDLVHRDIKPENVLLRRTPTGYRAKVSDFGISYLGTADPSGVACLGSPAYMAPEQFHDRGDERVDVYALGVLLYEILCGRRPFYGSPEHLMVCHQQALPDIPSGLPKPLGRVLRKALAKRPDRRTPSVLHFLTELDASLAPEILAELAETWPRAGNVRSIAVRECDVFLEGDDGFQRITPRGRLLEPLPGVRAIRTAGAFAALDRGHALDLVGPRSGRRIEERILPGWSVSAEGQLGLLDATSVRLFELDGDGCTTLPSEAGLTPTAVGFVGARQAPWTAWTRGERSFLTTPEGTLEAPGAGPIVSLVGHGERDEVAIRCQDDPTRVYFFRGGGVWSELVVTAPIAFDGASFVAAGDDGSLLAVDGRTGKISRTQMGDRLVAVGACPGALVFATASGQIHRMDTEGAG